jgi:hypothetical protein
MSIKVTGTVTIENATGSDTVFNITVTASTSLGTTVGTAQVQASATSPGTYTIDNILTPGPINLTFQGENLFDVTEVGMLGTMATNVVDATMQAVVTLSGTVSGSKGPISGATVTVIDSNNHDTSTTTDSSGAYSFPSLTIGQCTVDAEFNGRLKVGVLELNVGSNTRNFIMSSDEASDVPATIEGTVTDRESGAGLSGTVTATNTSTGATKTTTSSSAEGAFSFTLSAGTYNLTVSNVSGYPGGEVQDLGVQDGTIVQVNIPLTSIPPL